MSRSTNAGSGENGGESLRGSSGGENGESGGGLSSNYDFNAVTKWSPTDVAEWLRSKGHQEEYITLLCKEQRIDGKSLLLLTENDLRQPPVQIKILGDVKRLCFDILELQHICSSNNLGFSSSSNAFCGIGNIPCIYFPPSSSNTSHIESEIDYNLNGQGQSSTQTSTSTLLHPSCSYPHSNPGSMSQMKKVRRRKRRVSFVDSADDSQVTDLDEDPQSSCGEIKARGSNGNGVSQHHQADPSHAHRNGNGSNGNGRKPVLLGYASNLKPEVGKALIAMGYVFIVTWITAVTMVVVHDRVPSMEKYPPLPDLFLDNMPHIPWAFEMCEVTGTILLCIWMGVLFFHKHRFILIRRFFALSGTVFLLRCVTMLITSLSVPGTHLKCNPRVTPYGDWISRLYNAYLIWKGAGLSIQGVRTCGDYMFSGHTVALTMLNFFITEYTTRRLYFVHTISWLLNSFGIFFILSAHEHYSIDVFVAFYITSRLFLYYHTLANNQALLNRDSKRTKVWFPLFSFFESSVNGIVPNQYEFPITIQRLKRWGTLILKTMESKWKEIVPHPNEGFFRTKSFFQAKVKTSQ